MSRGFTLLELMIAVLLFSLISTAAFKLFSSVNMAYESTGSSLQSLAQLQRSMVMLEQDLLQITARPVRDEYGDSKAAVMVPGSSARLIEFTRSGWKNPVYEQRSRLQRVAYALEGQQLVRYFWSVLDRSQVSEPLRQVMFSGVESVKVRLLNRQERWVESWKPEDKSEQPMVRWQRLPVAVELTLISSQFGESQVLTPLSSPGEWPEEHSG
ncbi:MAG: type II secretion system minor pseudopilin GspJ [Endozoicomonas sp.]|uniref:type II secretion system minor pseudopilin GspJ n=1 Tax=Endozoicomonas sp. TaxID=1892382 RepID=UPI003D9BCEAF